MAKIVDVLLPLLLRRNGREEVGAERVELSLAIVVVTSRYRTHVDRFERTVCIEDRLISVQSHENRLSNTSGRVDMAYVIIVRRMMKTTLVNRAIIIKKTGPTKN